MGILNKKITTKKVSLEIKVDFAEKIKATNAATSNSSLFNIGYFFHQQSCHDLKTNSFFKIVTADMKIYDRAVIMFTAIDQK